MSQAGAIDFEAWYRREHPRLLGSLCVCALSGQVDIATDATDEAFARALARWHRVSVMSSPAGWTYRVALNHLRRRMRRRASTERRAVSRVGAPTSVEKRPIDDDVWHAVRALPDRQRTAIVLRYVADLPEAAIAEAMGVSRGTVASNLSTARRSLARFLTDDQSQSVRKPADPTEVLP